MTAHGQRSVLPAAICIAACLGWLAAADEVNLVIGHGRAVVREVRELSLAAPTNQLVLSDIPGEADLSSLVVRSRRIPIMVAEWRRISPAPPCVAPDLKVERTAGGAVVRWAPAEARPADPPPAPGGEPVLFSLVETLPAGRVELELLYVVDGFDWSASYQITARGEQEQEKEPVSMDLVGQVRVRNPCRRAFADARIWLVGPAAGPGAASQAGEPGFLMLDESNPLADLWRDLPQEPKADYAYPVPPRATLSRGDTDVLFARIARRPAERLYRMSSDEFPLSMSGKLLPLRRLIAFRNTAENGLGFNLPPGRADIYVGGMRTYRLQDAALPHTPAGGEIRVDLGAAEDVRGTRSSLERTEVSGGIYEETFRVRIENRRDSDIRVEIDEKPPVNLEWSVVRAGAANDIVGRRLVFRPDVSAGGQLELEYQLKIRRPEL